MINALEELNFPPCLQGSDPVEYLESGSKLQPESLDNIPPLHQQHGPPVKFLRVRG